MTRVVLIAEADGEIGFGHLAELRAIAGALSSSGADDSTFVIGARTETPLASGATWIASFDEVTSALHKTQPDAVIWSVRRDGWKRIWSDVSGLARHLWMADTDDDRPAADLVVMPTLDAEAADGILAGPAYFPLDPSTTPEVLSYEERSGDVIVSMGGADRSQATLAILPGLTGLRSTVVIGPAFVHAQAVRDLGRDLGLTVVENEANLLPLLARHRVVVTAGGNTLFEAAAVGTVAVVAWEDPHEEQRGRAAAEAGMGIVAGRGIDMTAEQIAAAVAKMLDRGAWEAASGAARKLVDGRGAFRIADAVCSLVAASVSGARA